MKIKELRTLAYGNWEINLCCEGDYFGELDVASEQQCPQRAYTNEIFKQAVRKRFGDLRKRQTWENAAIYFAAQSAVRSDLEPYMLVGYLAKADFVNCKIRQAYGDRLIDAVLQFPEAIKIIKEGLEQLINPLQDIDTVEQFLTLFSAKLPATALPAVVYAN